MGIKDFGDDMKNSLKKEVKELQEKIERLEEEHVLLKRVAMKKDYLIQSLEREIQLSKTKDLLTDSYNKQHLVKKFREAINMRKRWGFKISLCYFDMDEMSTLNKKYGTDFGDSLLMSFSKLSQYLIREELDTLFRIGGDEFLIILVDCNRENAIKVCNRIKREFKSITEGQSLSFGVSEVDNSNRLSLDDHLNVVKHDLEINKMIN